MLRLLLLLVITTRTIAQDTKNKEPNCKEVGEGVYPSEYCDQYYRCSKTLFFYSVKLDWCPYGQIFKKEANGCVIGTCNQTLVSPPVCDQTGPGYFVARRCNQYYHCVRILIWNSRYLKTCPDGQIFNANLQECFIGNCDD